MKEIKYQIKIYYNTGNSFYTEDCEALIEHEWKNLESVQKSLEHIKNHNEYYLEHNNDWEKPKGKFPPGVKWDNEYRMILLTLIDDDGKEFLYSSFWTGYFETLHLAEIIVKNDDIGSYRPS